MLLNQLLTCLNMPVTIRVGEIYAETLVENIVLLNSEPYIHLTTMNLGKTSELKKNQESNLLGIFLLIKDCEIDYSCFSETKVIMLEVPEIELDVLKQKAENILFYEPGVNDEVSRFVSKMLAATNLSGLLTLTSNYFRTQLVVASPGGRKIYAASDYDREKKQAVKMNPASISFTLESHAKSINNNYGKDFDNNMPYAIYIEDAKKWTLRSKVYYGSKYLGYLIAYTDSFLNTSRISIRLFKMLSEMVAHMIEMTSEKNKSQHNGEKGYLELFLGDILEGEVDQTHITIVGNHELFSQNLQKRVLNIPIKEYIYANKNDGYLIEKIREYFPYSISFYYKRDVIILLNEKKDGKNLNDIAGDFNDFLQENGLKVFCSDIFTGTYQMPAYYEQVKKIEKLLSRLQRTARIFWYDEFKFYDMALGSCGGATAELKKYCASILLQILEDDKNNGTDFYVLLKTYILSNKSMTECAEKLFIHKSTVAYRLNKMKEMYNLNIDSFDKVVEMYNSFRLLELIGI